MTDTRWYATCGILLVLSVPLETRAADVAALREAGDVPGLARMLRHTDGRVRSEAAVALSTAIQDEADADVLTPLLHPLIEISLTDPYATVREYTGRAVQRSIGRVTNVAVLRGAVPRLVDALDAGEVEERRRRFAAVRLSGLVPRISHEPVLTAAIPRLLAATLNDPHAEVREYSGRALASALKRVRDEETVHRTVIALSQALRHQDSKQRRYAATLLSGVVGNIDSVDTLRPISPRLRAATADEDETVREHAGRALRLVDSKLELAANDRRR